MKCQFACALFCENGHLICDDIERFSEKKSAFCSQCGAAVISECPSCHAPIRGNYYYWKQLQEPIVRTDPLEYSHFDSPLLSGHEYVIETPCKQSAYCPHCGAPYPWTEHLLEEAASVVELMDELPLSDKQVLKECFPDLISETATSTHSALIARKIIHSLSSLSQAALKNVLADFLSKTVLFLLGWSE